MRSNLRTPVVVKKVVGGRDQKAEAKEVIKPKMSDQQASLDLQQQHLWHLMLL